jgi:Ca2+-transporting ATPase
VAVIYIPFLRNAFSFTPINFIEFLTSLALSILVIPIVELVKLFLRKSNKV